VQVADRWHLMENASRAAVRKSMRSDHRAFGDNNGFVQGSVMQLSKPAVSEAAFVRCLPGRRMLSAPSLPVVTDEFTYRSADRQNICLRTAIDQEISAVFGRFNLKQQTIVHLQPGPRYFLTFYLAGNIPSQHTIATVPPMKLERPARERGPSCPSTSFDNHQCTRRNRTDVDRPVRFLGWAGFIHRPAIEC
jgi:hypothetical protein